MCRSLFDSCSRRFVISCRWLTYACRNFTRPHQHDMCVTSLLWTQMYTNQVPVTLYQTNNNMLLLHIPTIYELVSVSRQEAVHHQTSFLFLFYDFQYSIPFQCFDTVGLATGRAHGLQKLGVGLLMVSIWTELCTSYSSSCQYITSIILSSNKVQNGDILVLANPGPPGKWLLKQSVWFSSCVHYSCCCWPPTLTLPTAWFQYTPKYQ